LRVKSKCLSSDIGEALLASHPHIGNRRKWDVGQIASQADPTAFTVGRFGEAPPLKDEQPAQPPHHVCTANTEACEAVPPPRQSTHNLSAPPNPIAPQLPGPSSGSRNRRSSQPRGHTKSRSPSVSMGVHSWFTCFSPPSQLRALRVRHRKARRVTDAPYNKGSQDSGEISWGRSPTCQFWESLTPRGPDPL
jgi:hypothetical protein